MAYAGLFFSQPSKTRRVVNDVSQCRDFCFAERNFLATLTSAVALMLGGMSFLFIGVFQDMGISTQDIVFASLLISAALIVCVFAFVNYIQLFSALYLEIGKPGFAIIMAGVTLAAIGLTLTINIYEFFE